MVTEQVLDTIDGIDRIVAENKALRRQVEELSAALATLATKATISHGRIEACPADLGEGECICGFHRAVGDARRLLARAAPARCGGGGEVAE